jgi:ribosomal protein S18 acetylase RimI-like enzyme
MSDAGRPNAVIRIREELRVADAERIPVLVAQTGFFSAEEIAIARELVEESLRKGRASGYWFVLADAGDELVGYACFGPVPATVSSYHLYWIAVAPPLQGRGLGRTLLDRAAALARAAGGERLYSETSMRPQYAPTRAFYESTGFRLVASLPAYFAPGDGKAIYEKYVGP